MTTNKVLALVVILQCDGMRQEGFPVSVPQTYTKVHIKCFDLLFDLRI